jgi:TrpR-related protein YerC/YecD
MERLFRTIASLQTAEECRDFFDDLCTVKELQDMAQRYDTAILLDRGYSYQKIAETVSISTATISRVNRCLNYGAGGYRTAIARMAGTEDDSDDQ